LLIIFQLKCNPKSTADEKKHKKTFLRCVVVKVLVSKHKTKKTNSISKYLLNISVLFFRHLDFFEMMRNDDEKVLAKKFEGVSIPNKIFKNLN